MNRTSRPPCTAFSSAARLLLGCARAAVLLLGATLVLSARLPAAGQTSDALDLTELPLEALMEMEVPKVYGASKVEQKTTEAPSSITVVTADEIKRHGYRTLAEILQSAQGFHVSYDRNYAFLGARGLSLGDFNSRVLLLVNGHRINNNLTDGAFIGTAFILDVDLIDRVEIIRGPGSVLYGNNAFFGVINVITREGGQIDGAEVSGEYGSFNTVKARVTYGKLFSNGAELLLSGTIYDSDGEDRLYYREFDTPQQNDGVAVDMDADRFASGFGSLRYGDFTLESGYIAREKVNPTAQYSLTTFNDPRLRTTDERGYAALKFARSFPEVVDVTARVYYDHYAFRIGYPQSLIVGTNVLFSAFSVEKSVGDWWGAEVQFDKRLGDHVFTLGAEYRDDFRQETRLVGQAPVERDRQSHGVFFQGDIAVRTNLHFHGGVRYDQYGEFDASWNPRLALIYNPVKTSTLKAIYGTAFRAPNFSELSDQRFQNVQPEEITSYELIYEQEIGRHIRSSVSVFYNEMDDLIVFESGSFANFDAETTGAEFALQAQLPKGIRGRASYSLQNTRATGLAWDLPDSPTHLVKLNVSVPVWQEKLFAGVEFQYTSERRSLNNTTDPFGQPLTVQGEEAGGFGIVNLTLFSQNLIEDLEFSAGVYNVFDRRYSDPASRFHVQDLLERDGRTFRFKLTYHF